MSIPDFNSEEEGAYAKEIKYVKHFKKAILMTAGAAVQKFMMNFDKEQEVIMHIADMAINTYTAESALLRVLKLAGKQGGFLHFANLSVSINERLQHIFPHG